MKCLDHIDLAALTGAVAVLASAAFLFAWLGVERGPMTPTAPTGPETFLAAHLEQAIAAAVDAPARADVERGLTQEAVGQSIVRLSRVRERTRAWIPELATVARVAAARRHEFLEGRFKLPADWGGTAFAAMERKAEAMVQPPLGRRIVTQSLAIAGQLGAGEEAYGRALLAATQASDRAAVEPEASLNTIAGAAGALRSLPRRIEPAVAGEAARPVGSGADGWFVPFLVLVAGVGLVIAAGAGLAASRGPSSRRMEAYCETAGKDVEVTVLLSDDTPYEVTGCSAFNGGPVTCGKHCLKWPVAHAA